MASLSGWKATAVALAAAAALSFPALDAHALVLGRLNVLSALGEPLQAEIDVPQLSNEEADSLRTELASPEAFRAAGLEYNSALIGMQLTLQRRPGGRAVIRVTSNRPVNDPFVDLILQLTWSSGRVVRDYTVLLDPPAMRQNNPAANAANNTPAQVPAPATTSAPTPAAVPAPRPAPAPSIQATAPAAPRAIEAPRPPAPAPRPAPAPTPAPARAQPPAAAPVAPATATTGEPSGKQVTVKPGDTASRIAAANKPASVSLDQMLVALLRSNPDAFVQNNVNRMKAGSVLEVPSASQAAATPPAEASQIITAQARDFDSFRRALAGNAPSVRTAEASRSASGRVQTQVDERKPSTTAPDKLTLSKGGIQGQVSEEQIAREKAARDAADRVAELSKNISELNKLGAASTATTAATPAASAPAPAPAPTPTASAPAGADVPAATASAPAEASTSAATGTTPAVTASAPEAPAPAPVASAPAAPTVAAAPAPAPAEESSWLDTLTENPMLPAAGAGLLALLAALGIYRSRERKKAAQLDSSFLESKMSGDSFFGSSGGQQVDTSAEEGEGPASSLSYSPSQLDAAGDVDPVAEADVYLAYGRDLQAEEILREALRNNPERIAIHAKLLDIYAKRRDVTSYAAQALVARDLTQREGSGQGHEWTRIAEIGRQLDPANPLYRPESNASGAASDATAHIPLSFPVPTEAAPLAAGSLQADAQPNTAASLDSDSNALDFDLDLALDLDLDKNSQAAALAAEEPEPVISLDLGEPRVEPTIDIPLLPEDKPSAASDEVAPTVLAFGDDDLLATPPTPAPGLPEVDFDLGEPDDVPVPTPAPATPAQPVPPAPDYNNAALTVPAALEPASPAPEASPLDFDLNLDIDLSPASDVPPPAPSADLDDDELPELDAAQQRPVQDSDMIEFDLGSLSLDLGDSTPTGAPAAPASAASAAETKPASAPTAATPAATEPAAAEEELDINDPLATKLALAEEFHSIGDEDGAKALAEEVLEEATGSLRAKAERFLAGMA